MKAESRESMVSDLKHTFQCFHKKSNYLLSFPAFVGLGNVNLYDIFTRQIGNQYICSLIVCLKTEASNFFEPKAILAYQK